MFEGKGETKVAAFVALMKKQFPEVPSTTETGGSTGTFSTHLHLGVCYYEIEATKHFVGEGKARKIFETDPIYPWVRKQVLKKGPRILARLKEAGLEFK